MHILAKLSDFETITVYIQSSFVVRFVRNMMGISQYVVAIGIHGEVHVHNTKYRGVCS